MAAPSERAIFHLADRGPGWALLEVEGSLDDAALVRWTALLRGLLAEGRDRIAFDLRGCRAIGPHCLDGLLAAAVVARGSGGGLVVVTLPGSEMARVLRRHEGDLSLYTSVKEALRAWDAALVSSRLIFTPPRSMI
jgi:anti-anti-sigma regulatory factor